MFLSQRTLSHNKWYLGTFYQWPQPGTEKSKAKSTTDLFMLVTQDYTCVTVEFSFDSIWLQLFTFTCSFIFKVKKQQMLLKQCVSNTFLFLQGTLYRVPNLDWHLSTVEQGSYRQYL